MVHNNIPVQAARNYVEKLTENQLRMMIGSRIWIQEKVKLKDRAVFPARHNRHGPRGGRSRGRQPAAPCSEIHSSGQLHDSSTDDKSHPA